MGVHADEALVERSPAQFFFEVGFGACWAEAFIRNEETPPFDMTDAIVEHAWDIAGEAHEDPAEFDHYLALANATPSEPLTQGEVIQADRDAAARHEWDGYFHPPHADAIRAGKHDDRWFVQAFRDHRLASTATLQRKLDMAREALEAFAAVGEHMADSDGWSDDDVVNLHVDDCNFESIDARHFRRARTTLDALKEGDRG